MITGSGTSKIILQANSIYTKQKITMDYRITGSNLTVKAADLPIGDYGIIYSDGINNTIYLKANVSAAPGGGNNYI